MCSSITFIASIEPIKYDWHYDVGAWKGNCIPMRIVDDVWVPQFSNISDIKNGICDGIGVLMSPSIIWYQDPLYLLWYL